MGTASQTDLPASRIVIGNLNKIKQRMGSPIRVAFHSLPLYKASIQIDEQCPYFCFQRSPFENPRGSRLCMLD
jgi:hypothetical protein